MWYDLAQHRIVGNAGHLSVAEHDEIAIRLAMLIEGECEGLGAVKAAEKYGISKQRYYQLLKQFNQSGAPGLQPQKRGPKSHHVRTSETVRQVIRHRVLDSDASAEVIGQKLRQAGFVISTRSVERIIEDYGLQKKTLSLPPQP